MNASHTNCTHAATAVARRQCRDAAALVRRMNASLVKETADTQVYRVPNHPTYLVVWTSRDAVRTSFVAAA
jgi:hypothetical protein